MYPRCCVRRRYRTKCRPWRMAAANLPNLSPRLVRFSPHEAATGKVRGCGHHQSGLAWRQSRQASSSYRFSLCPHAWFEAFALPGPCVNGPIGEGGCNSKSPILPVFVPDPVPKREPRTQNPTSGFFPVCFHHHHRTTAPPHHHRSFSTSFTRSIETFFKISSPCIPIRYFVSPVRILCTFHCYLEHSFASHILFAFHVLTC